MSRRYNASIAVRFPEATLSRLQMEAQHRQLDVSDLVREAVRKYIAHLEQGKPAEQPELMEAAK